MSQSFFIFLLTISTIFSSNCMELSAPKKSSKDKGITRSKSKSVLSLSRKSSASSEDKSSVISPRDEHPFITIVKETLISKDYTALTFHLSNPYFDPNVLSKNGFSALHLFARVADCKGIGILNKNPRVDFSTKDTDQNLASHYIDKSSLPLKDLLHSMFVRGTLDIVTKQECDHIKVFYKKDANMNEVFSQKIEIIKTKLLSSTKSQNDDKNDDTRKFEIEWPNYATDEFMHAKMWFILSSPLH